MSDEGLVVKGDVSREEMMDVLAAGTEPPREEPKRKKPKRDNTSAYANTAYRDAPQQDAGPSVREQRAMPAREQKAEAKAQAEAKTKPTPMAEDGYEELTQGKAVAISRPNSSVSTVGRVDTGDSGPKVNAAFQGDGPEDGGISLDVAFLENSNTGAQQDRSNAGFDNGGAQWDGPLPDYSELRVQDLDGDYDFASVASA